MSVERIVVAADASEASLEAVRGALRWAARAGGQVTVLSVSSPRPAPVGSGTGRGRDDSPLPAIEIRLRGELEPGGRPPILAEAWGVPSIEIARYAEAAGADLLVLGRKPRSAASRLLLGDTADAVARRSSVPCLFVPADLQVPEELLVALDGTTRGNVVLHAAQGLAAALRAQLRFVTVEPARPDEPDGDGTTVPLARTTSLARQLGDQADALRVRRGDIVEQVLEEIERTCVPVLIIGYHRGGPPAVVDAGSAARRLAHRAPCAVLTIPL